MDDGYFVKQTASGLRRSRRNPKKDPASVEKPGLKFMYA